MNVPATIETEPQSLLEVIARAARDPNVDIDKMERLLEMQERVHARNAREEYALALAELQPKLPVITERGRILNKSEAVQSTYAYWEDVNEAIRLICMLGRQSRTWTTCSPGVAPMPSDTLTKPALIEAGAIIEAASAQLSEPEDRVFRAIVAAYPDAISRGDLADQMGYSRTASTLGVYIAKSSSFGFVETSPGKVRAADWLFP